MKASTHEISKQVILITGASSGFGASAARALAAAGHTVLASMRDTAGRNAPQVAALERHAAEQGLALHAVELDVQSQASADAAIDYVLTTHGRLGDLLSPRLQEAAGQGSRA